MGRNPSSISREVRRNCAKIRRSAKATMLTIITIAEPHKPWQRGTNENTNDILRFFFPKGFDFRTISQAQLDSVVDLINNRPRKCLGWKSPAEIFVALT